MIIDSLSNYKTYLGVHPNLQKAFEYLLKADFSQLTEGRNEIEGAEIFIMMNHRAALKQPFDAPLEAHNRYIDIQIVIEGEESYGWSIRPGVEKQKGEFDVEKDIVFFDDTPSTYFTLQAGEMALFFPNDAHAPLIGKGYVKKCIVKVLV